MAAPTCRVSRHALQESLFQPMGFRLRVLTNHPAVMTAAEASFRGFGAARPVSSPDFTLHLLAHDVEDGQLREPKLRAEGSLICRTTGHASTLMADRERGLAWGYLPLDTRRFFPELATYTTPQKRGGNDRTPYVAVCFRPLICDKQY